MVDAGRFFRSSILRITGTCDRAMRRSTGNMPPGGIGTKPILAYCRIGERSSHSWFVLKYLLGYDKVTNYDGSWTEWGNLVGAPIETGA